MLQRTILILLSSYIFIGCLELGPSYSKLPPGPWRGVLKLDPQKNVTDELKKEVRASEEIEFDEVTEGDLPFNFEVIYTTSDSFYIEISNAEERIKLDDITYRRDKASIKDTLIINFPPYDSYLKVLFEDNILEGYWHIPSRGNYQIHVIAKHGQNYRFTNLKKEPIADLTGKWEVYFGLEDTIQKAAIGEFVQSQNRLTGTFLTETGDYRYLEGTVQANKLYLSGFDGANMFLFEALIREDGTLSGVFRNGIHALTSWSGKRNENFKLKNADSLTYLIDKKPISFKLPDENGQLISLDDDQFYGKAKVIQLMGTWSSNCVDQSKFIVDFMQKNDTKDLAIIGLAFERQQNNDQARAAIRRFRDKLSIPYPILYAGSDDLKEASRIMAQFSEIKSYPTLIFLNKENNVVRIYTGFSGPATSHYASYISDFEETIKSLLDNDL